MYKKTSNDNLFDVGNMLFNSNSNTTFKLTKFDLALSNNSY